jgi:hypothetical protein
VSNSATWREFPLSNICNMLFTLVSLLLVTVVAGDCAADNCLRALKSTHVTGGIEAPQAFCATLAPGSTVPEYVASACQDNQNGPLSFRISSACACIAGTVATTAASSPSSVLPVTTTRSAAITHSSTAPSKTVEACAIVSSYWASQLSNTPTGLYTHVTWNPVDFLSGPYRRSSDRP